MPQVRSFTEFARAGLGNWAGFAVGWLYWYFWIIVIPVEAIAGATILHRWLESVPVWQLGCALMAAMGGVNLMSARSFGEFEFWFASIKVIAIIVFIAVCAAYAFGFTSPTGATFGNLTGYGGFAPFGAVAILAGCTTVFFSMMGAEIVTIAAAESTEPAKSVARMVSTVVWRILAFYIGSITLIVSVVPWNTVKAGESPFAHALDHMGIPYAGSIMSLIVLTAVLSCLNSSFYVASRVLFVLAERGDAPRWLVATNRRHVPARSVLLAAAAGFAGVIAAILSPEIVFGWLVKASGALIVFIYMSICMSQIRLRRARERANAPPPLLPMWFFPWLSYLAIIGDDRDAGRHGNGSGPAQPALGQLHQRGGGADRVRHPAPAHRLARSMVEHVRVLVIGGGAVGCSCLYHLAQLGWTDALLLEQRRADLGLDLARRRQLSQRSPRSRASRSCSNIPPRSIGDSASARLSRSTITSPARCAWPTRPSAWTSTATSLGLARSTASTTSC